MTPGVATPRDCMGLCDSYGVDCIGTFYWQSTQECFLKQYNVYDEGSNGGAPDQSTDNNVDEAARDAGSVAMIKGNCAEWSDNGTSSLTIT